jgi:phosphoadenosine phosphosulfate reductase
LTDANILQTRVITISDVFSALDLAQRIAVARREIRGRMVFTTSFSIENQAITDAIFTQSLETEMLTLDTGRLFPEIYELWGDTERRYGRRIRALYPNRQRLETLVALNGFRASVGARQACCTARKIEPLGRALASAAAWITGLRAEQSAGRALITSASVDQQYQLIKINPLFEWTRDRVAVYVRDRGVPYNSLHDRGFLSIGCEPCSRSVLPGEPERAGRWWWEHDEKRECGVHTRLPVFLNESNQA